MPFNSHEDIQQVNSHVKLQLELRESDCSSGYTEMGSGQHDEREVKAAKITQELNDK